LTKTQVKHKIRDSKGAGLQGSRPFPVLSGNRSPPPISKVDLIGRKSKTKDGVIILSNGTPVSVPSVGGISSAFKDFGIGALGGLIFLLARQFFGGLGVIAAPLLAGSMIKGDRGSTIATMAGFMLLALAAFGTSSSNSDAGVM